VRVAISRWVAPIAVAASLAGCMPAASAVGPSGYEQPDYHYHLAYRDLASQSFLGPEWDIDNFYKDPSSGAWSPKESPEYTADRLLDVHGDGDRHVFHEYVYDLKFVNQRDNGVIWLKAHPLEPETAKRDLDVVLENYAFGLSGTSLYAQSNLFNLETTTSHQFTTFVVSKEPLRLGQVPAVAGTIDLAETDKLRIDPNARSGRVRVIFAKFQIYKSTEGVEALPWPVDNLQGNTYYRIPILLVIGYYNNLAQFDRHLDDFARLLTQISFDSG
jgi:hypothetical protein